MVVKKVNLFFDEEDHKKLVEKKGKRSWEQLVLSTLNNGDDKQ